MIFLPFYIRRNTWQLFKNKTKSPTASDRFEWNGMSSFEVRSKTLPLAKEGKSNKVTSPLYLICRTSLQSYKKTFIRNVLVYFF